MMKKNPGISMFLLMLFCCLIMTSCEKVSVDLGSDFVDNNTTNLVYVDSATVEISTINVDSFITSGTGSVLVGNFSDPQFGKTVASSFIQMSAPAAFSFPNGAVFDSLELLLPYNKYFYGDTLTPFTISVHQLTSPISLPNNQYSFYNTNKQDYNTTELGHTQFYMRPGTADTVPIRLLQTLGQELFDKMVSSDQDVADDAHFVDYFKGLAITGGTGNNLLLDFKDSVVMRLHYRNPGVINTDAYVDFSVYQPSYQYNHISTDRTATPIATLGKANSLLLSTQTQNAGFGQYITGSMIKIRFPYLYNLLELNDFVKIIKADLVLKPVKNSFTDYYTLPPYLRLSATDQYNLPGTDLTAYSASTASYATEYGNLFIDGLYGAETAYTYDVTTYLQAQIALTDYNKNGLLLLPPSPELTFNRIMIGDRLNAESKTTLKIYYASVK